jgi:hypothetical protein
MVKQNIFLIAGHGSEKVVDFTKRSRVPTDKIIVTFPICGRVNFMKTVCRITHMLNMKEHAEVLANPIDNKQAIELLFGLNTPMRIYLPTDYMPQMSTNLFLDFDFQKEGIILMKSGVYRINKIPEINRALLPPINTVEQKLGSTFCTPFIGRLNNPSEYTPIVHKELYRGNIYKPALVDGHDYQLERDFTITNIITSVGKGIYYYIGCRSLEPNYDVSIYNNIFDVSDSQQKRSNRSKKFKDIIPLLESDKPTPLAETKTKAPTPAPHKPPAKAPTPAPAPPTPSPPPKPDTIKAVRQRRTLNRRIRPPLKKAAIV